MSNRRPEGKKDGIESSKIATYWKTHFGTSCPYQENGSKLSPLRLATVLPKIKPPKTIENDLGYSGGLNTLEVSANAKLSEEERKLISNIQTAIGESVRRPYSATPNSMSNQHKQWNSNKTTPQKSQINTNTNIDNHNVNSPPKSKSPYLKKVNRPSTAHGMKQINKSNIGFIHKINENDSRSSQETNDLPDWLSADGLHNDGYKPIYTEYSVDKEIQDKIYVEGLDDDDDDPESNSIHENQNQNISHPHKTVSFAITNTNTTTTNTTTVATSSLSSSQRKLNFKQDNNKFNRNNNRTDENPILTQYHLYQNTSNNTSNNTTNNTDNKLKTQDNSIHEEIKDDSKLMNITTTTSTLSTITINNTSSSPFNPMNNILKLSLLSGLKDAKKTLKKVSISSPTSTSNTNTPNKRDPAITRVEDLAAWDKLQVEVAKFNLERSIASIEFGNKLGDGKSLESSISNGIVDGNITSDGYNNNRNGNGSSTGQQTIDNDHVHEEYPTLATQNNFPSLKRNQINNNSNSRSNSNPRSPTLIHKSITIDNASTSTSTSTSIALKQAKWGDSSTSSSTQDSEAFDKESSTSIPPASISKEFCNEIIALSLLNHTCIVGLYGVICKPRLVLVMELLTCNLATRLHDTTWQESTSVTDRLKLMLDVMSAIAFIHGKGFIHRDIKAHNILLKEDGMNKSAKLSDFGTAIPIKVNEKLFEEIGTSGYTAPEIFTKEGYSSSADIFSFGILLWESFTREFDNPLCGKDPERLVIEMKNDLRPKITPEHPPVIEELVTA
eukprot:gene11274-23587_t